MLGIVTTGHAEIDRKISEELRRGIVGLEQIRDFIYPIISDERIPVRVN